MEQLFFFRPAGEFFWSPVYQEHFLSWVFQLSIFRGNGNYTFAVSRALTYLEPLFLCLWKIKESADLLKKYKCINNHVHVLNDSVIRVAFSIYHLSDVLHKNKTNTLRNFSNLFLGSKTAIYSKTVKTKY